MTEQQRCERYLSVELRRPKPSRVLLRGWIASGGKERTFWIVMKRMGLREVQGYVRRLTPGTGPLCACEGKAGERRPMLLDGARCSKCGRPVW